MRQRGIVADYLRHPDAPQNLARNPAISAGQDPPLAILPAEQTLAAVNTVLDGFAERSPDPFAIHPLAADFRAITLAVLAAGYEPQHIRLTGATATVLASTRSPELAVIELRRTPSGWDILR
jgi:hypothetical protein